MCIIAPSVFNNVQQQKFHGRLLSCNIISFLLFILRYQLPAQLTVISIAVSDDDESYMEVAAVSAMVGVCRYCIYEKMKKTNGLYGIITSRDFSNFDIGLKNMRRV